jgi:iron-sulfur cluster assembly protein
VELARLIRYVHIKGEEYDMNLQLTDTAAAEVKRFFAEEEDMPAEGGLRVRVIPGGCSGFQYAMEVEEAPQEDDAVVEAKGVRVFVDMFSAQYLDNVELVIPRGRPRLRIRAPSR